MTSHPPCIKRKFLSINNLYKFETAQIMFKYKNKQLPQAFQNFFTLKTFCMKTRSNSSSFCRTTASQQSLKFVGPKIWNTIPPAIRDCQSSSIFKRKLTQHLLNLLQIPG